MNPLVTKLSAYAHLSPSDIGAVENMTCHAVQFAGLQRLTTEGEPGSFINVLLDGWACRFGIVADGRRQITSVLMRGDFCDLSLLVLKRNRDSTLSLTAGRYAAIHKDTLAKVMRDHPSVACAIWRCVAIEDATLRQRIINIGRKTAEERTAHLLCELLARAKIMGLKVTDESAMPLTQEQLGDALGLTAVHMNRSMKKLREHGLVTVQGRRMYIHDENGLKGLAQFDDNYLQLA